MGPSLYFVPGESILLPVNGYNFPELNKLFQDLVHRASAHPMQLVIHKNYPNKAYIASDHRTIAVSLDQININDFSSLQFLLGHEIGHRWQELNRGRTNYTHHAGSALRGRGGSVGACLSGVPVGDLARGILNMGPSGGANHPTNDLRISALYKMQPQDCDFYALPPSVPPWLRRPDNKKARD